MWDYLQHLSFWDWLALGTLLLLMGTALLVVQGFAWLDLEPRMLRALEGGALCALGTALGAVPVLVMIFLMVNALRARPEVPHD